MLISEKKERWEEKVQKYQKLPASKLFDEGLRENYWQTPMTVLQEDSWLPGLPRETIYTKGLEAEG